MLKIKKKPLRFYKDEVKITFVPVYICTYVKDVRNNNIL